MDLKGRTREDVKAYFVETFTQYEQLFSMIRRDEAYFMQPEPLRHPLIFYYAHTAVFFVNKMLLMKYITQRLDPKLESMCAIGVDEMSWDDLDSSHYDWPPVDQVRKYRARVREVVCNFIDTLPEKLPSNGLTWSDPYWIMMMGIEHERIHFETSSVIMRMLPIDELMPSAAFRLCDEFDAAPKNGLVHIDGGSVNFQKQVEAPNPLYAWDNEYGTHQSDVQAFKVSKYLVSNGEFFDFVEAGGYQNASFWSAEGWKWKKYVSAGFPRFWISNEGQKGRLVKSQLRLRTMTAIVEMPWSWPAEINYHEAKAFCKWKGNNFRLPTEDEWYLMYDRFIGKPMFTDVSANVGLTYFGSSCPVNKFAHGPVYDLVGNTWQWTETPIDGFKGFEPHPAYDDFSVPTFDMRHNLIKGGSWISTGNEAMRDSRYAFRRHFYQHAGFRYVESPVQIAPMSDSDGSSVYETDESVAQYLEFHYGGKYFDVPNFAARIANIGVEAMQSLQLPLGSAMDIGCSVGRTSFHLAEKGFKHVLGLDFSARFIQQAVKFQQVERLRFAVRDEGDLFSYKEALLSSFASTQAAKRVVFMQADACNIDGKHTGFDLVIAANLIDRLYDPAKFLTTIHSRINARGLLLIASPYTWLSDFTEKERWIGGFKMNGENVTTLDGLSKLLSPNFRQVGAPQDVDFVIRETKRKFQHSSSEVTIWQRL